MKTFKQLCDQAVMERDVSSMRHFLMSAAHGMGTEQVKEACRAFLQLMQELEKDSNS